MLPSRRTLSAPSSSRSRLTVACVAATPVSASRPTNSSWLPTRPLAQPVGDHALALLLAAHRRASAAIMVPTPSSVNSSTRMACSARPSIMWRLSDPALDRLGAGEQLGDHARR